jgi:hypothetical protein
MTPEIAERIRTQSYADAYVKLKAARDDRENCWNDYKHGEASIGDWDDELKKYKAAYKAYVIECADADREFQANMDAGKGRGF